MRRLLATIVMLVLAAALAACSNDEPPPVIHRRPRSSRRVDGAPRRQRADVDGFERPTGVTAGLPTGAAGWAPGKLKSGQAAFSVTATSRRARRSPTS
jgi:hypothetical protein